MLRLRHAKLLSHTNTLYWVNLLGEYFIVLAENTLI